MYGLGAAESQLGAFARDRRDGITIATKFGIAPAKAPRLLSRIQAPARFLANRVPALRSLAKRQGESLHERSYDVPTARASLQRSLRELETDYVDLFFIHDPEPDSAIDLEGICEFLEEARQAGHVRAWGIAGEHDPCVRLRDSMPRQAVLQIRDDVYSRDETVLDGEEATITFGILSGALERVVSRARTEPRWGEGLGLDMTDPSVVAPLLLRDALAANPSGAVLFSSTRVDRIRSQIARSTEVGGEADLASFRDLLRSDRVPA
jgi:D-threo-aldose 1-dehydrogenase